MVLLLRHLRRRWLWWCMLGPFALALLLCLRRSNGWYCRLCFHVLTGFCLTKPTIRGFFVHRSTGRWNSQVWDMGNRGPVMVTNVIRTYGVTYSFIIVFFQNWPESSKVLLPMLPLKIWAPELRRFFSVRWDVRYKKRDTGIPSGFISIARVEYIERWKAKTHAPLALQ